MLRLTALPRDVLLRLLLHHFTAQELIQLRSLCVEVYQLVQYCLERRRTLKLFFSFTDLQFYSRQLYVNNLECDPQLRLHSAGQLNDDLLLDPVKFNGQVVDLLVDRLFPNVRHLIICIGSETILSTGNSHVYPHRNSLMESVSYLLHKMSPTLTGLSLFGTISSFHHSHFFQQIECHFVSRPLIRQINKMQQLRRLDLCIRDMILRSDNVTWSYLDIDKIGCKQTILTLEPKVLNKLERIWMYYRDEKFLQETVSHLGPSCTELYLVNLQTFKPGTLYRALVSRPNTNVISHLRLCHDMDRLAQLLPRFDSLKSLDLSNHYSTSVPLVDVVWLLKRNCPRLTDLKLSGFVLNWANNVQTNQATFPQLNQIINLMINCTLLHPPNKTSNKNIPIDNFVFALAHIFPSLTKLSLKSLPTFFVNDPSNPISEQHFIPRMPQLRKLCIGTYWSEQYTFHHLLSRHHRKIYLNALEINLENNYLLFCKDETSGCWKKMSFC